MKLYIASSWKNAPFLRMLALLLRDAGHEVDCFCEEQGGRYVFNADEMAVACRWTGLTDFDYQTLLRTEQAMRAFAEDRKWLDWCDCCIMVHPCGQSAHLEAGYAAGIGKKLVILARMQSGTYDVMYGFADAILDIDNPRMVDGLIDELRTYEPADAGEEKE